MRRFNVATLAAIGTVAGFAPAQAQMRDCIVNGNPAAWGQNMTGYFSVASGSSCNAGIQIAGVFDSSTVLRRPQHGTVTQVNISTFQYAAKAGYKGHDSFAIQAKGTGPTSSGTSVVNLRVTVK